MLTELLPCPFCGHVIFAGDDYIDSIYPADRERTLWSVHCTGNEGGCDASTLADSREGAIAAWNRRAKQSEQAVAPSAEAGERARFEAWFASEVGRPFDPLRLLDVAQERAWICCMEAARTAPAEVSEAMLDAAADTYCAFSTDCNLDGMRAALVAALEAA